VRLSLYHRGYSGYSLLPLPRATVERQIVQRRRRDAEGGDEHAHPQNRGNDRAPRLAARPSGLLPRNTGGVPDSTPSGTVGGSRVRCRRCRRPAPPTGRTRPP
jgi:hypothetical protein